MKKILALLLLAFSTSLGQPTPPASGSLTVNSTTGAITAPVSAALFKSANSIGSGSGTVTSVSVTTANGVSGTVATATTTPAISLTLGAISPSSVSTGALTSSALTSGRVPFASTAGLLADSSAFTFNSGTGALTATSFVGSFTGTATNATNVAITDDTTTNATMYPAWVTANTGNLPVKVSSTKMSFNPSTGTALLTGSLGMGVAGDTLTSPPLLSINKNAAAPSVLTGLATDAQTNIRLSGADSTQSGITMLGYAGLPCLFGYSAGGTGATPTATTAGFGVRIGGGGYTGSAWVGPKAEIVFSALETFSGSAQGTSIVFRTTAATTTTRIDAFTMTSTATQSVLTGGATNMLQVAGTGNSRTWTLQTTTSGGTATDAISVGATQIFTKVNGLTTAGYGVPTIVAAGRVTAQSAANASISTYTLPAADGSFEVSANLNCTAATSLITTLTCTYTDESNTSRTMIFPVSQLTGSFIALGAITGTGAWETPIMHIRCKASTAITILTSTGTFTGVTYTAEGIIKRTN